MRITTIGTSHGDATYCRYNTSTLIEAGDRMYLIDAGAPVEAQLVRMGKDFGKLHAIFLTHMHLDHVGGLPGTVKMLKKYPNPGLVTKIYFPQEDLIAPFQGWLNATAPADADNIDYCVTDAGHIFDDGVISVDAIPTRHAEYCNQRSFSFVIRAEGKTVLFTGDLRFDFVDYPKIALERHFDLAFCEATHYNPDEAAPILARSKQTCFLSRPQSVARRTG